MVVDYNRTNSGLLYLVGFLYFAVSNLSRMLQFAGIPREAMYVFFLAVLAIYFAKNLRAIGLVDVLYYAVVGSLTVWGLLKYSSYIEMRAQVLSMVILYLPAYLFFRLFSRHEAILAECVTAAGWYAAFYLLAYYVFCVRGNMGYSMPYAYWVSFPVCVLFHRFFETRRWRELVAASVLYVTLILSGCRGALLLTTLFGIVTAIEAARRFKEHWTVGKTLCLLGVIALVALVAFSMDSILSYLEQFSAISRNIRKLFDGNYLESTTRDAIYQTCKQLISDHPEGYGPLASRQLLWGDNYPHSLWYELQLDYGAVLGIFLFCVVCFITLYNVVAYRDSKLSMVVNYMAIIGMGSLMLSSSYYYEMNVPAMCGLFVARLMAYRQRVRLSAGRMEMPPPPGWERDGFHAR